jgi:hypothetical protein
LSRQSIPAHLGRVPRVSENAPDFSEVACPKSNLLSSQEDKIGSIFRWIGSATLVTPKCAKKNNKASHYLRSFVQFLLGRFGKFTNLGEIVPGWSLGGETNGKKRRQVSAPDRE